MDAPEKRQLEVERLRRKAARSRRANAVAGTALSTLAVFMFVDAGASGMLSPAIWFILAALSGSFFGAFSGRERRRRDAIYGSGLLLAAAVVFTWVSGHHTTAVCLFIAELAVGVLAWIDASKRPDSLLEDKVE